MANIDKKSVRNEVDQVKAEFEQLCDAGKVSSEIKVLMGSMLMIMELILSIFLERKTKKNSNNSSLPPSQTDKDETALPPKGGHQKGKKENNAMADNARTIETVTVSEVCFCEVCGEDLQAVSAQGHERRTKIDILFEKVIDHVDAEIKQCPGCDATTKGSFPADRHGPLQ
jgi:hypothetical protein